MMTAMALIILIVLFAFRPKIIFVPVRVRSHKYKKILCWLILCTWLLSYPQSQVLANHKILATRQEEPLPQRLVVTFAPQAGVQIMGVENPFLVIDVEEGLSPSEYQTVLDYWQNFPNVLAVEPDYVTYATDVVPNDPKFIFDSKGQYELREPGKIPVSTYQVPSYGINLPATWELTTGNQSNPIYIAVVDSGYQPHDDMTGVWFGGYDFVSDTSISGDGDGYDQNPYGQHAHGLRVASVIGANTNNGLGIAGINWNARLIPVRALGATGTGYLSDAAAAVRWAAGLPVSNVPPNPYPAKIINMSLGSWTGGAPCPLYLQSAIDEAYNRGAIVVVSAGNTSEDAMNYTPANCQNVITVGASYHLNMRSIASFSAYGDLVDIYAPGSNMITAENQTAYTLGSGTSFSAPTVSGIISLMLDVNPNLTFEEIRFILQNTALPFTSQTNCAAKSICGNKVVNPPNAVYAAMTWNNSPIPTNTPVLPTFTPTSTNTPALPTFTPTPTNTPALPTFTPTPTNTPALPTFTPAPTETATPLPPTHIIHTPTLFPTTLPSTPIPSPTPPTIPTPDPASFAPVQPKQLPPTQSEITIYLPKPISLPATISAWLVSSLYTPIKPLEVLGVRNDSVVIQVNAGNINGLSAEKSQTFAVYLRFESDDPQEWLSEPFEIIHRYNVYLPMVRK